MPRYTTADIRNIALVGPSGAGKTTLVESLLYVAGATKAKGSVQKGTTVSDFLSAEREHQHSLASSILSFDYLGKHINLLDTPGSPDLIGRALSVLPAVETVAVVIDAGTGPEMTSRRVMSWAKERGLDRLIIINRIDAPDVDMEGCLAQVQDAFGAECLPLNLPAKGRKSVVDCFFQPNGAAAEFSGVEQAHTRLIDQVVEVDEALMELYLEQGQDLSPEQLHAPFEQALREDHLVPVCFTSAESDAGVAELLKVFAELMPNPTEGNPPDFYRGKVDGQAPIHFASDPKAHVLAHVFKVSIDPFIGRLGVFRIHQGTVGKDSQLFVGEARKPFRVGHLLKVNGKETAEVDAGIPGDICAVAKIDDIEFDAVLHDSHDEDEIHLKPIELPAPMQGIAITAKTRGDEQKISDALHKLKAEDPSIRIEHNHILNETVIHAMGELHLRILLEELKDRFHVEVNTSPPKIAYRETILGSAEGHYRHKKQTGGAGQFGEVYLRVRPLERGAGFRFVDEVVGGVIPRQFIPAVEKGIRQALSEGAIAGFEVHDVEVSVYDGKHHPVDSKEIAFVTAGKRAFIDAVRKANPVVLEPIVDIHVNVPSNYMGDITGDLSSKRGRISNTTSGGGGMTLISAQIPLSELNGYQSHLKSMTGGTGTFSLEFSHYDPVPARIQEQLIAAHRPREAEE
jgi:elongation factor G